jgi:hypothetical protein
MKYLLITFAFAASGAIACPADGAKDAMAPISKTPVATVAAATKTKPIAAPTASNTKRVTKVAAKSTIDQRKSASL